MAKELAIGATKARVDFMHQKLIERLNVSTIQELNDIFWPNGIPFQNVQGSTANNIVEPGNTILTSLSVSADAAFVITKIIGVSYYSDDPETMPWEYINQENPQGDQNANGLTWQLQDSNSTRLFTNGIVPMEMLGSGRFPWKLSEPLMVWPASRYTLQFSNAREDDRQFLVKPVIWGYRLRVPAPLLEQSL